MPKSRNEITQEDVLRCLEYRPEDGVFIRTRKINQAPVGSIAGVVACSGARQIKVCGADFMDYDLAWLVTYGALPSGSIVHIDGNRANARIGNLVDVDLSGELTAEILRLLVLYEPETGVFVRRVLIGSRNKAVGEEVGSINKASGYLYIPVAGHLYLAHRLAWLYMTGEWPLNEIDHINGARDDNRWANIRDVDRSTNAQNKREALSNNKSSGLLGVSWSSAMSAFLASITVRGDVIRLGYFDCKHEAYDAYIKAKRDLHDGCTI